MHQNRWQSRLRVFAPDPLGELTPFPQTPQPGRLDLGAYEGAAGTNNAPTFKKAHAATVWITSGAFSMAWLN